MSRATIARPKRPATTKAPVRQFRVIRSALNYLDSLTNYEQVPTRQYSSGNFGLARMNRILSAVGNPHRAFKSIHVVGTKGKGSTAVMLYEMLRACGMKVGLYTSPHILDVRERIAVNGECISESAFTKTVSTVAASTDKASVAQPTYFEVLTAAAFCHFAAEEVEIAIVEVGMGGRLDSTNVLNPEVIAVTNISLDHLAQLGRDRASIAREKAGVFKKRVPIVSSPQPPDVKEVFAEMAEAVEAPLRYANENVGFSYRFEFSRSAGRHARICLTTEHCRFEHVQVPLLGEHQAANCALALNILDVLKGRGFEIDDQQAITGLANLQLSGRMEIISESPRILVDGAHNAASIDALMRGIGQHITYDSMVVIFGCQKDKDISGMIRRLQLGADKIIFTSTGSQRSADPTEIAAMYTEMSGKMAQVSPTLEGALHIAGSAITREDLICVTGSFQLVARAIRLRMSQTT